MIERGQTYPLVLYLHGASERGDDNRAQLKFLPEWMAAGDNRRRYPTLSVGAAVSGRPAVG